jgi:superfamily II DNA or RNA helicase
MLRRQKVLAKIDYDPILTGLTYELTPQERSYLEARFDFPPGFLKRVASDDIRNIEIMKRLILECGQDRRVLFFGCSVQHSRFVTAMLIYFGVKAAHVDGSTDRSLRRDVIQGFKDGRIQVLCNYGVLSTGFDAPNTDVVFISRPTGSVVLYSQMIGRGLRGPAIGGTERCKVIDVRDNIVGFGDQDSIYTYFDDYWLD